MDLQHNQPIYTVSEVSQAIKRTVEDHFGLIQLRGEISGFKLHSSGHAYFTLKDDEAVIDAVCWRGSVSKLKFKAEDGLEVIATGKVTTYPGRSKYQIVVDRMEPAGAGALMALLEKRKKQLESEGLFDPKRKKQLPYLPQVIGVITSPTGAVIRDILHRLSDRFPLHVIVWPVAVQGEGAAEQVAEAIAGFNALNESSIPKPDLLIVARGGGSIEDLWAFNEEIVVRAAADSQIPLISAVGHETDTTLIDYASDRRAPTPTAAAEMAVPVRSELMMTLAQLQLRMSQGQQQRFHRLSDKLEGLSRGLPKPQALLEQKTQRLDDWAERLLLALPQLIKRKQDTLHLLASRLQPRLLLQEIVSVSKQISDLHQRSGLAVMRSLERRSQTLSSIDSLLEALNYQRVLERGFVLVKSESGKLITKSKEASGEKTLTLQFSDGDITASPTPL
ncbi:MAG: exodeoxyribonuclease VII large subunit [Rickettsiales bacterium]|jgi:exodeoxyribonuclease VII large subunit|nr:exodeoxyribonuclease VII large subunit [Rickettsiales bacterium]